MVLHTNGRGEKCLLYPFVLAFLGSRIAELLHLKSEEVGKGVVEGTQTKKSTPTQYCLRWLPASQLAYANPLGNSWALTFHSTPVIFEQLRKKTTNTTLLTTMLCQIRKAFK